MVAPTGYLRFTVVGCRIIFQKKLSALPVIDSNYKVKS